MMSVVIDRFENDKAILLFEDEEKSVIFPKKYLPRDVDEGDYLRINIVADKEATNAARKEAKELLEKLKKQNK